MPYEKIFDMSKWYSDEVKRPLGHVVFRHIRMKEKSICESEVCFSYYFIVSVSIFIVPFYFRLVKPLQTPRYCICVLDGFGLAILIGLYRLYTRFEQT